MEYVNHKWQRSASEVMKMELDEIYKLVKDPVFRDRMLADCDNFSNSWMDLDIFEAFTGRKWNRKEVVKIEKGDRQAIGHWVREWAQARIKMESKAEYWENRRQSEESRAKELLELRKEIPEEFRTVSMDDFKSEGQKKIIESILKHGFSFLLCGEQGIGKTRLAWLIWYTIKAEDKKTVRLLKMFELRWILQDSSFKSPSMLDMINNAFVLKLDVLIVDEVDKISMTDAAFANLFYLIDRRCEEHKQTIFLGNGTKKTLEEKLGTSLMSRFNSKSYRSKILELKGENHRLMDPKTEGQGESA